MGSPLLGAASLTFASGSFNAMKPLHINLILTASALALSATSFFVVIQGASDEPYTVFRQSDAVVQVGVAMVLMLLWIQLAVGIVAGVVRRCVSWLWSPLLIWVLICEFYLFQSPRGYVQDITRYVAPQD
jgi:hypothetical protein